MIPNNNLSVLPWYTSVEQQNARKWWIYDRVYPLFTPAMFMLPFEIMRQHRPDYIGGHIIPSSEYDIGALRPNGSWDQGVREYGVSVYEDLNETAVFFTNLPKPPSGYVCAVAKDANGNLLGVFNPDFVDETFSGPWELPENTVSLYVQTYDDEGDIRGDVRKAIPSEEPDITMKLYDKHGVYIRDFDMAAMSVRVKYFPTLGYDVIIYGGRTPVFEQLANGQYYATLFDGVQIWYSEVFTVVNDIDPYLKITWWDNEDFTMDAGTIVYKYAGGTQFRNVLYLQADIAKPEYPFEEEGETRDGYFFPTKQISEKRYRFSFLASEYLLDVMRFIRMADFATIEYHGKTYSLDTFLITPEWEDEGDVASVQAEFDTATVAKKIGLGYIKAQRGDFNDDFNNDFNNE